MAALIDVASLLLGLALLVAAVVKVRLQMQYLHGIGAHYYSLRRGMQPWEQTLAERRGYRKWLQETEKTRLNKAMTWLIVLGIAGLAWVGHLSR